MNKPNHADRDFGSTDCSSSVSNPFYHTEFTTVPTPEQAEARRLTEAEAMTTDEIKRELRESGVDVDAFLKRCSETLDDCYQKALDALPPEMIQYGVKLVTHDGEVVDGLRWRDWRDAAQFAENEVKANRASGFWVFKEAAV